MMPEIGTKGQFKLKNSKVLVVGVGGLGSIVSQYLVRSGIGKIGILDFDKIEPSNLHRQILYDEKHMNKSKVEIAEKKLMESCESCEVESYTFNINEKDDFYEFSYYDVIVDCTDNIVARKKIDELSRKYGKKVIFGAVQNFEGIITIFDGSTNNSYLNFLGSDKVDDESKDKGILGPIPGIIGSYQALEVLKELIGIKSDLHENLLLFDGYENIWTKIKRVRQEEKGKKC